MNSENFYLFGGIILSLIVILFDLTILTFGIKKIDPLENLELLKKIGIPASIGEIFYIIWAYNFLSEKIVFLLIFASFVSLIVKQLKIEGYKFIIYVLSPLAEISIVAYGIYYLLKIA